MHWLLHTSSSTNKRTRRPWRGKSLNFAAGGMVDSVTLEQAGLDPRRYGAISFAFGLERCAQIRYDLDDVRKLWQPPYVPK